MGEGRGHLLPQQKQVSSAPLTSADPWLMKELPRLKSVAVQPLCVQLHTGTAHILY